MDYGIIRPKGRGPRRAALVLAILSSVVFATTGCPHGPNTNNSNLGNGNTSNTNSGGHDPGPIVTLGDIDIPAYGTIKFIRFGGYGGDCVIVYKPQGKPSVTYKLTNGTPESGEYPDVAGKLVIESITVGQDTFRNFEYIELKKPLRPNTAGKTHTLFGLKGERTSDGKSFITPVGLVRINT